MQVAVESIEGIVREGVEVRGSASGVFCLSVSLDCVVCDALGGLFIEPAGKLVFGDFDFEGGVDRSALHIFVITKDAFGVFSAGLALGAGREDVSSKKDLILGCRLDSEVFIGANLREVRFLPCLPSSMHNIIPERLLKLLTPHSLPHSHYNLLDHGCTN